VTTDRKEATDLNPWKGHISYVATVECADCSMSESYTATYRPARFFLQQGWSKRAGLWRCPEHARRFIAGDAPGQPGEKGQGQ
jgi:hypothetical protein